MMNPDPKEYHFNNYTLRFYRGKYQLGGGTALVAYCTNGEMYGSVSVNLENVKIPSDHIFLDMNNCKTLCQKMLKDKLLELTGLEYQSGYCIYPAARMTNKLKEILEEL